ncbi:regulatory protein RecX [Paeniglutamicibacter sp. MACA_103]|uniref:regulatory protein RecX n=1 Tax=Paeniglutamicibacter sp. MACA_103 TaxID=3377337 RepID=UPI003894D030
MGTTKHQGGSSGSRQGAERPLWSFPADGNSDWGDPTEIPAWAHSEAASAAPPPEEAPGPPEAKPAFGERSGYAGRSSARAPKRGAGGAGSWGGGGRSSQSGSKRTSARPPRTRDRTPREAKEPVELTDEQYATKGRAVILRQLTASAKSRAQLKTKLLEKEIPEHIAEELLERFEEIQLVDDEAFAEGWVRSRSRSRGLARSAIKRELRDKGIEGDIAENALEQIDEESEEATARDLVERKLRAPSMGADKEKSVRRLVGMLARKGYGPGMAFRLVNEAWEERFGPDSEY